MGDNSIKAFRPVFYHWWRNLTDAGNEGRNADRAALANLRRLDLTDFGEGPRPDVAKALTQDAFRNLYLKIQPLAEDREADLVIAAVTLARIRTDAPGQTTAGLLGGRDEEDRKMKQSRFLRLMRVSTSGDLFDQARRIANLLGGTAPIGELGASLLLWRHVPSVRRDWARAYYGLDRSNSDNLDQQSAQAGA
jgi:CRISPR type I-E-associated protein CasB/Cse2